MAASLKADGMAAFVPAKDFALAQRFYRDLGFTLQYADDAIAIVAIGGSRFLLQNAYEPTWAGNCMMQLAVDDCGAWYDHIVAQRLAERYPGVKVRGPQMEAWGLREVHLIDPSGVLWHIAELGS